MPFQSGSERSKGADNASLRPAGARGRGRKGVAQSIMDWLDAHTDRSLTTVREFFLGDEGYNEWRFKRRTWTASGSRPTESTTTTSRTD